MAAHPIDDVYVDSVQPDKADIRAHFKGEVALVLANEAAVTSLDLTGQKHLVIDGRLWQVDDADTTSSAVAGLIAVSNDGKRFKRHTGQIYGDAPSSGGTIVILRTADQGRTMTVVAPTDGDTGGPFIFDTANSWDFRVDGSSALRVDGSGNVGIGDGTPLTMFDVNADSIRVRTSQTPASASATGVQGEIAWDANYFYICTATNTWRRVAHATW